VAEAPGVDVPLGLGVLAVQPSIAPTRAAAPASRRNSRRSMGSSQSWAWLDGTSLYP
jgi:hypothetical protein